jgi:uncharacterized OB-fold protein
MAEKVIPLDMIPDKGSEVLTIDGIPYIQSNTAMFTFYKRSKGELSPYFLGLREKKIYGAKCGKCGIIRVPPFMEYCPDCEFAKMERIEMPHTGKLIHTPPITYFAHSLFQDMAPYGRGRVLLGESATALPILVYTTKGVLRPGIFKRDTPIKVVFRDERLGEPTDIFAVPISELSKEQIEKKGLQESELDWTSPQEPRIKETAEGRNALDKALNGLSKMADGVKTSARAQHDLSGWRRVVQINTSGGPFEIKIDDGKLEVKEGHSDTPDLIMVCEDPGLFSDWVELGESLTNAIIAGKLWISKNSEFQTVFKLDRVPRSLKRTP